MAPARRLDRLTFALCIVIAAALGGTMLSAGTDGDTGDLAPRTDQVTAETPQAVSPLRINFSPAGVEPPAGYQRDSGLPFDPIRTYGWNFSAATRHRIGAGDIKDHTFAFTESIRRWTAAIANGDYQLDLRAGDPHFSQGPMSISIGGTPLIDDQSTTAGEFIDVSQRIEVRNGVIALELGGGTSNQNTVINLLEAVKLIDGPVGMTSISFQPAETVTPLGYRVDNGEALSFGVEVTSGWDVAVPSRARQQLIGAEDSFVFSASPRTYSEDAANGYYDVWFSLGDPRYSQGPQRVVVEGILAADNVMTTAPESQLFHALVHVSDGRMDVTIGGGGGLTVLSQFSYAQADPDLDGDGVLNESDSCPFVINPQQTDSDADGAGDACDPCPLDPADDADGDGVCSPQDNCFAIPNSGQEDDDNDGDGNACDACPQDPDNDLDTDGVCGDLDNCPTTANADQLDLDGDGEGDACDSDIDGDTVANAVDNCPMVINSAQGDVDGDGVGDACVVIGVNFARPTTETLAGYLPDAGQLFSPVSGFGWERQLSSRDRGTPGGSIADRLKDSFVFTTAARTFTLEMPNGDYDIDVQAGDRGYAQGQHRVVLNGVVALDGETTPTNQFVQATVRVPVRNGRLTLDAGGFGAGARTTLNSIRAVAAADAVLAGDLVAINFQPAGADTPVGYVADSGQLYDPGTGRGWSAALGSRERGRSTPQTRDTLVFSRWVRVFEVALAPGTYTVLVEIGDPSFAHPDQRVVVEGVELINGSGTAASTFSQLTTTVPVIDGRLTLEIGGTAANTVLNQLVIERVEDPATD